MRDTIAMSKAASPHGGRNERWTLAMIHELGMHVLAKSSKKLSSTVNNYFTPI